MDENDYNSEESFAITSQLVNGIRNKSAEVKNIKLTLERVQTKIIIDTGSSVNLIDKNTFHKIVKVNKSLILKKANTKIFPYASRPIDILGYFHGTFENKNHYTAEKDFDVNKENAGNLLSIHTAKDLKYIDVKVSIGT